MFVYVSPHNYISLAIMQIPQNNAQNSFLNTKIFKIGAYLYNNQVTTIFTQQRERDFLTLRRTSMFLSFDNETRSTR